MMKKGEFNGHAFVPSFDENRLTGQMRGIHGLMKDRNWRTLSEIENYTGYPQASISASLRNFRKDSWGKNIVNKQRRGNPAHGLFEYQLIMNLTGI
jgi:predicted transcriptional regulator